VLTQNQIKESPHGKDVLHSPALALVYDKERQKGNANRATLAVARKFVAYLVAVDRTQKDFLMIENQNPRGLCREQRALCRARLLAESR
jgi:hypothetical protein